MVWNIDDNTSHGNTWLRLSEKYNKYKFDLFHLLSGA
jgi:hypothetical protein